jgi:hypothetical protein
MSSTLSELVRAQILAEGPDIAGEQDWDNQHKYDDACEAYIDETLDQMTRAELLERISDALDQILRELPTRLGI